jgi:hypothetical protein
MDGNPLDVVPSKRSLRGEESGRAGSRFPMATERRTFGFIDFAFPPCENPRGRLIFQGSGRQSAKAFRSEATIQKWIFFSLMFAAGKRRSCARMLDGCS